ncbi:hypothetical protein RFI_09682, partial [Reticulomyxa filosa]
NEQLSADSTTQQASEKKKEKIVTDFLTIDQNELNLDEALADVTASEHFILIESTEMSAKRTRVIADIEKMACEWIRTVSCSKGRMDDEQQRAYVCCYGSYELGVHFESSDMDLLCIGPRHIRQQDFFSQFVTILRANSNICNILVIAKTIPYLFIYIYLFYSIPSAFVPLLKFTYMDIDIDMVYAQWNKDMIDPTTLDLFDNSCVAPNKESIMSVNGLFVCVCVLVSLLALLSPLCRCANTHNQRRKNNAIDQETSSKLDCFPKIPPSN